MSSEDTAVWRDTLTNNVTKAIKAAKKLGYSGEAFTALMAIAWSSYQAGENDSKQDAKKSNNNHVEEKKS